MLRVNRKELTRKEIIRVAANCFLKDGYSKTTINAICKTLKMSPGNLTFHFPTKEHLLAELVDMLCKYQQKMMEEELQEGYSSIMTICLEFLTIASACAQDEIAKEFFLASYTSSLSLDRIRKSDIVRAKEVFREHCPEWTEENFEASENADLGKYPTGANGFLNGLNYHKPDVSQSSGMHMVDFPMQWNFRDVESAFSAAKGSHKYYNAPNTNVPTATEAPKPTETEVEEQKVFTELGDVYAAEWYANAVAWAYNNSIVTGDLNTKKFNPNKDVTREQLALMIYRYASYKNYDLSATSDFAGLVNAEKVSNWSADGVKWAVGQGLISGVEKNGVKDLDLQGNASRAQMAAILQRFCENVK